MPPTSFPGDDLEELFRSLEDARRAADAQVRPWQAALTAGDYFSRPTRVGIRVYGQILPDEEERPRHLQHYRFCLAYSVACPDGELGDVHVSTIDSLLSQREFEYWRKRGWQL